MVKVNVAALKAELSHYLEIVENGEPVLVTSHGKEIARITPIDSKNIEPIQWVEFSQKHPLMVTKTIGDDAVTLVNKIRDED